ncbi:MAG: transporter suffix domain-containing protein [Motiliproteus sp.]
MKKTIGYVLLVLSFVPWGLIAVLPFLELSKTEIAGATTILIVTAEVTFVAAIALLGKEAWAHIKARFKAKK